MTIVQAFISSQLNYCNSLLCGVTDALDQQWSPLNRFRTEQGHCGACRRKWRLTDTDLCPCGETDNVSHCRILSLNKTEWRLISATLWGWRRRFVADQLWFMTRIREEEDRYQQTTEFCAISGFVSRVSRLSSPSGISWMRHCRIFLTRDYQSARPMRLRCPYICPSVRQIIYAFNSYAISHVKFHCNRLTTV